MSAGKRVSDLRAGDRFYHQNEPVTCVKVAPVAGRQDEGWTTPAHIITTENMTVGTYMEVWVRLVEEVNINVDHRD